MVGPTPPPHKTTLVTETYIPDINLPLPTTAEESVNSDNMMPPWETACGPRRLRILSTKFTLKMGTWNVRTLFQSGKPLNVANEMARYILDILGLTEVRWDNFGECCLQTGHTLLYSGQQTQAPIHTQGVGLLLTKEAQKSLLSWEPHSSRLMEATFRTQQKKINLRIVVCYAPTNNATDEEKDQFYEELTALYAKKHSNKNLTLLIGDMNAKIGNLNQGYETIMGKHALGEMNDNGRRFADFCLEHDLVIGGSVFPHKNIHKETWISNDGVTKNQIDHICVSRKFRRSLLDVRSYRGADANSDHQLVIGKLQFKLKKIENDKNNRIKYNTDALKDEQVRNQFQITLRNKFEILAQEDHPAVTDINDDWNKVKMAYKDVSQEVLGIQKRKSTPWISQSSLDLIENRRLLKEQLICSLGADRHQLQENYNRLNVCIKRSVRKDKRAYTEDLANKAQEAADKNDLRNLYQITKKLSGKNTKNSGAHIKDSDGNLITTTEETQQRWVEHFSSILNRPPPQETANIPPADQRLDLNCEPPTLEEIKKAIDYLKNNKSAGPDDITAELLKADAETAANQLLPIIQKIWQDEIYPNDWKNGHITVLPKKGDLTLCTNHRGIMLLSIPGKVLSRIILERMKNEVDILLRKNQAGFRKNRSCTDQTATLRIIIEQSMEFNSPLYLNFIDYSKAFDSIDRKMLWKIMAHYGVPDKLINLIRSMYSNSGGQILYKGKLSVFFEIATGVRQGCLLSPFLFLLCIDWIMKNSTNDKRTGIQWTLTEMLDDLDFADDIGLTSHNHRQMQDKTDSICQNSAKIGLQLNAAKTQVMKINTNNPNQIVANDVQIGEVNKFCYLGSIVAPDGGTEADITARINKAKAVFAQLSKVWNSSAVKIKTKLKIFNSNVKSILLYGSETWFLSTVLENKLQVFLNKCLRRILKIFWPRTISNKDLWDKTNQEPLSLQIKKKKFRWLGHTLRKPNNDITKQALRWNPQGTRKRGRPKLTWRRQLIKELKEKALDLDKAETLAQDRKKWRDLVYGLSS